MRGCPATAGAHRPAEVDRVLRDGERPDRERELEVAVAVDAPERPHRRAAPDGLELRDQVDRRDLRGTRDRAARKRRMEQRRQADTRSQGSLDPRDEMLDPRERPRRHQLGPPHAALLADAREIIALEVDDHQVLGGVLRRREQFLAPTEGPRPLDGHRPDAVPAPREEQLRRRRDDCPAVALEHPPGGVAERELARLCQVAQPGGERARRPGKRRAEVLDEVDLVDVAARDRGTHRLHRRGVLLCRPGPLPRTEREQVARRTRCRRPTHRIVIAFVAISETRMPSRSDGTRRQR
jgi:hypothetical protein